LVHVTTTLVEGAIFIRAVLVEDDAWTCFR
jgi:hypothetical protein